MPDSIPHSRDVHHYALLSTGSGPCCRQGQDSLSWKTAEGAHTAMGPLAETGSWPVVVAEVNREAATDGTDQLRYTPGADAEVLIANCRAANEGNTGNRELFMTAWTFEDIPSQSGRKAIVTGANTGIGFETALALARKGACVTLACRDLEKGKVAINRILSEAADATVSLEKLDLADLRNVEAFAARFRGRHDRLDMLILNAGVMVPPEGKTAQGFELQFGVNHLGHFALTGALLPLVQATVGSRVVVVSSTAARRGAMHFDDLQFKKRGYAPWQAYGQSKLANQMFALELQRRLRANGSSVLVTAAHPGWTATELQRSSGLVRFLNHIFAMQPPQGALPTLRAATDPSATGGDYYGPSGFLQMRGYPKRVDMVDRARDTAGTARLWEISEELTGVHYDLLAP